MRTALRRRATRAIAPFAVVAAVLLGCADFGTDPDVAVAIQFDRLPYPAVVAGDSLRDSLGVVAPLRALAFNGRGGQIPDPEFVYFSRDTGVTIDSIGRLRASRRDGTVRLVASVNGIQSETRTLRVTRRPDTTFASGAELVTLAYVLPDAATNLAPELRLSLRSRDTVGVSPNVGGWLVRWRTVHNGDTLAATDTTLVALQSAGGRRSTLDTTTAEGTSSRRLRVFANRLSTLADSFVVLADVRLHGVPVPGSPVRFVVTVAPLAP